MLPSAATPTRVSFLRCLADNAQVVSSSALYSCSGQSSYHRCSSLMVTCQYFLCPPVTPCWCSSSFRYSGGISAVLVRFCLVAAMRISCVSTLICLSLELCLLVRALRQVWSRGVVLNAEIMSGYGLPWPATRVCMGLSEVVLGLPRLRAVYSQTVFGSVCQQSVFFFILSLISHFSFICLWHSAFFFVPFLISHFSFLCLKQEKISWRVCKRQSLGDDWQQTNADQ